MLQTDFSSQNVPLVSDKSQKYDSINEVDPIEKRKCISANLVLFLAFTIVLVLIFSYNPFSKISKHPNTKNNVFSNDEVVTYINNEDVQNQLTEYINKFLSDDDCIDEWPNSKPCYVWIDDEINNVKYVLTNSIPSTDITGDDYTYCPFGIGKGYCFTDADDNIDLGSDGCDHFSGMICPSQDGETVGDVPEVVFFLYQVPINPDPTLVTQAKHIYDQEIVKWYLGYKVSTGNEYSYEFDNKLETLDSYKGQGIGVTLDGLEVMGASEAEGYNVDTVGIPFICGGHITPPVAFGSIWHFHKATTCLDTENELENLETSDNDLYNSISSNDEISKIYKHSNLLGYAADGFGIYGVNDINGETPIVDECSGHFGPIAYDFENNVQIVTYHYHMKDYIYNEANGDTFEPYIMGCQGPSLMTCDQIDGSDYIDSYSHCGSGCGSQLCVQTGTTKNGLQTYISSFDNSDNYLSEYTINIDLTDDDENKSTV